MAAGLIALAAKAPRARVRTGAARRTKTRSRYAQEGRCEVEKQGREMESHTREADGGGGVEASAKRARRASWLSLTDQGPAAQPMSARAQRAPSGVHEVAVTQHEWPARQHALSGCTSPCLRPAEYKSVRLPGGKSPFHIIHIPRHVEHITVSRPLLGLHHALPQSNTLLHPRIPLPPGQVIGQRQPLARPRGTLLDHRPSSASCPSLPPPAVGMGPKQCLPRSVASTMRRSQRSAST